MAAPALTLDRTYPSRSSSHPRKANRPRIEGGTVAVRPASLVGITAAYLHDFIERAEVRVWAVLCELREQYRLGVASGGSRPVTAERVAEVLGVSVSAAEKGIDVLVDLGLVTLDGGPAPTFPVAAWQVQNPGLRRHVERLIRMVGQSEAKSMPLPRRVLRAWYKQRRGGRTEFGVHVGMLWRVLFVSRYDDYKGFVTLRWLEDFADAPRSSVKDARSRLVANGLFETLPIDDRVVARCGPWYRLVPTALGAPDENIHSSCGKGRENRSPCQNHVRPSDEKENHTHTSHARAQDATRGVFTQHSKAASASGRQQRQGALAQGQQRGSLRGIQRCQLRDPQAVDRLFEAAVEAGHVSDTPADRRLVFELACHAVRVGKAAGALFYRDLVTPAYHRFVSAEDEDAARRMLAELEAPTDEGLMVTATTFQQARNSAAVVPTGTDDHEGAADGLAPLPGDVDAVRTLGIALMRQGVALEQAFGVMMADREGRRCLAGWDRQRWEAGCDEGPAEPGGEKAPDQGVGDGVEYPWDDDPKLRARIEGGGDEEEEAREICHTYGSWRVDGEWYVRDDSAADGGEDVGASGGDVVRAGAGRVPGVRSGLRCTWSDCGAVIQTRFRGVVPASGGSAVSGDRSQHEDTHWLPVRFADFDLESAAGVDREVEALFCRTCEGWLLGGRRHRRDDEDGHRSDSGGLLGDGDVRGPKCDRVTRPEDQRPCT